MLAANDADAEEERVAGETGLSGHRVQVIWHSFVEIALHMLGIPLVCYIGYIIIFWNISARSSLQRQLSFVCPLGYVFKRLSFLRLWKTSILHKTCEGSVEEGNIYCTRVRSLLQLCPRVFRAFLAFPIIIFYQLAQMLTLILFQGQH